MANRIGNHIWKNRKQIETRILCDLCVQTVAGERKGEKKITTTTIRTET